MNTQENSNEGRRQPVTLYCLRNHYVNDFENKFPIVGRHKVASENSMEGFFYPIPGEVEPPSWLTEVTSILEPNSAVQLTSQHPGGILLIKYQKQHFVFTFGHAWSSLKEEWVEPNFGKRVALNSIPRDQLSELKAEQIFAAWHLSSERAPAPTSFAKFGLESDRDLVHAIEGRPMASTAALLGNSIRGATSLKISIDFLRLKDVLDLVISLEQKSDYKKIWPEIDNLTVVKDQSTITALNQKLDAELCDAKKVRSIILVAPTLKNSDYPIPSGFIIGRLSPLGKSGRASCSYLMMGNWLSYLSKTKEVPCVASARATAVHFLGEDDKPIAQCRLYDCIGFETSLAVQPRSHINYVLSAGTWYEASMDFKNKINSELATLCAPSSHPLKIWNTTHDEGEFNKSCIAVGNGLYLFDAKNINFGGGQSKFEFCDLYHEPSKTLYFVKHVGASNHFSHLSEQVRRTIELVFGPNDAFRGELRKKIEKLHSGLNTDWLKGRPNQGDFQLCIVSMGKHHNDYPFFAKCGLARLLKELRKLNHNVSFLKV